MKLWQKNAVRKIDTFVCSVIFFYINVYNLVLPKPFETCNIFLVGLCYLNLDPILHGQTLGAMGGEATMV